MEITDLILEEMKELRDTIKSIKELEENRNSFIDRFIFETKELMKNTYNDIPKMMRQELHKEMHATSSDLTKQIKRQILEEMPEIMDNSYVFQNFKHSFKCILDKLDNLEMCLKGINNITTVKTTNKEEKTPIDVRKLSKNGRYLLKCIIDFSNFYKTKECNISYFDIFKKPTNELEYSRIRPLKAELEKFGIISYKNNRTVTFHYYNHEKLPEIRKQLENVEWEYLEYN